LYKKILIPIDLAHRDRLAKAIDTAVDLARRYGAPLVIVGVTEETPGPVAHNPQEYARRLDAFADELARTHGIATQAKAYAAHDPATQIDETLLKAVGETGADLVVMASHPPTAGGALLPSHGGRLASHAAVSVFLVR
jgi:nucleotide-binding universal stress UspA family protein